MAVMVSSIVAVQDRGQGYMAEILPKHPIPLDLMLHIFPLLSLSKALIPHDLKVKKSFLLERPRRSRFGSFKEMCSKIQRASQSSGPNLEGFGSVSSSSLNLSHRVNINGN